MSQPGFGYEACRSDGRELWLMRIGPAEAPPILIVPPLFEEMNRLRALLASAMRGLALRGFCTWLPDLSGSGESQQPLETVEWSDWRHDVGSAAAHARKMSGRQPLAAAFRGGCLIDDEAEACGWWRLAPVTGKSLTRDMVRAGLAGVEWAGYAPSHSLRVELEEAVAAEPTPLRTVRLSSDAGPADTRLGGPALWRRSEPGNSGTLAEAIAADIADWATTCAVS